MRIAHDWVCIGDSYISRGAVSQIKSQPDGRVSKKGYGVGTSRLNDRGYDGQREFGVAASTSVPLTNNR
jgi:hypothetical protein